MSQHDTTDAASLVQALQRSLATIEFDLDGTVRDANENFLAATGYHKDEVVGRHHRMFVDPAYSDSSEYREFWTRLRAGEPQTGTFARVGKGGRAVWLQASYCPILDANGRATKVVKFCSDVTAQQLAARAVEQERARIAMESSRVKSALDGATTNVMIANERFEIVYMNESLIAMFRKNEASIQRDLPQFRVEGLMGTSIDRFHKNPSHQHNVLGGLRGHHKVQLNLGGRVFSLIAGVARDEKNHTVGFSVEWVDITDQVTAQRDVERVLTAAIDGDLTPRIHAERYEGFVRTVSDGMNKLLDSVADSFRQVKVAVEQIGQAATQLRATSQMMSSSSVELNRAAMESSGSVVKSSEMSKSNAENAAMANQLVTQTSSAAQGGQGRMEEMSAAMGEINASAQQIAKIIKVIDEIAFQTNLLALNAAVEAARAGRHGKGFAVVAQEVRNLAERSAKAAKETAQLIEDSVAKVSQGVRIADATRGALKEIVTNVVKVVDLVGEIATASGEQSRTLRSVSESMGQVTEGAQAGSQQSNEVASAAEEMSRQMEILKQRMDKYRVAAPASANGLPAGITPELLEHLLGMMRAQGLPAPANVQAGPASYGAPAQRTGTGDPRAVLPLDRDERGFGGF